MPLDNCTLIGPKYKTAVKIKGMKVALERPSMRSPNNSQSGNIDNNLSEDK